MGKQTQRIHKLKDSPNEDVKDLANETDKYFALEVLSESEGGKIVINSHIKDIVNTIDTLSAKYKALTHIEMVALCADMKTKIDVVRTLTRAKKNRIALQDALEEALKE
jgi:hypothetical protein